ncbi:hypothetical protein pb186bvf_003754 [Paramecium bursaria]
MFRMKYMFATIKKYSQFHEWVVYDTETKLAKIGITDFCQQQIGDVAHVKFPQVGQKFKQLESIGELETLKISIDLISPFSGECIAINENLLDSSTQINENAEKTWIILAKLQNLNELDELLEKDQYLESLK